jgi:hypothetical protein
MAVAKVSGIDGASATVVTNISGGTRTTYSQAITIPAGHSNIVLVVETYGEDGTVADSTVKWNTSESLALASDGVRTATAHGTSFSRTNTWLLKNPTTGTHNVDVVVSGLSRCGCAIYLLEGVDQTTPVRDVRTTFSDAGGTSNTITHTGMQTGDLALDHVSVDGSPHTPMTATGTGHVADTGALDFGFGSNMEITGSNADVGGAMGFSWATAGPYSHVSVAFKVVPVVVATFTTTQTDVTPIRANAPIVAVR